MCTRVQSYAPPEGCWHEQGGGGGGVGYKMAEFTSRNLYSGPRAPLRGEASCAAAAAEAVAAHKKQSCDPKTRA